MLNVIPAVRSALQELSSIVWLLVHTAQEMSEYALRGRFPFRLSIFFEQTDRAGVGSIPLVALVSFFIGLTMALLTGYQLQSFGQERLVPSLVAIAFTRELGPLMTGIMLAARIGAAYTAELGTMTVAEEVEAIEAMGLGPLRFLVSPRVLAVFFLMPCLAVVSDITAMTGGALISRWAFDIPFESFVESALESLLIRDIVAGVLKSFLFGLIIGLIACYKGLAVKGGAAGVGTATTSSVVTAITTVIGFDTVVNIVLVALFDKMNADTPQPIVELNDVHLSFDKKEILSGIDLRLGQGERLVVLGQSGGGKSTLLRLILGILRPTSGTVLFKGQDVSRMSRRQLNQVRQKIGMVYQYSALISSLSVRDNLALPLEELTDKSREEIDEIVTQKLELVDMAEARDKMPAELSGGMRKRVGLARGIIMDPELILYDEPSAGLDPVISSVIDELIIGLSEKIGATSIVVTHEMESAFRIATRMAMIFKGKIIADETPEDFRNLSDPVVAQFITGSTEGPILENAST